MMTATYRLQFRNGMTFERAAGLVPYLKALGVSHLYASPLFTAAGGSTHGYDVTDANRLDPALGGEAGFRVLSDALKDHGLGLVLDIVPNHMAASTENRWWASVLEWGEQSPYAGHFDIDWQAGPLTLPFLGATFEDCLARGELALAVRSEGRLVLTYYDNWWPLAPKSYALILDRITDKRFDPIRNRVARATPQDAGDIHEAVRDTVTQTDFTARFKTVERDADLIREIHASQAWRLYEWRTGRQHLTYRRFFEITGLVGLRVEDDHVFDDVHHTVMTLIAEGRVDGLRIDHVDGLADPTGYLKHLREAVGPDVPILVEKILEADEPLTPDWPVEGTTGYEFIAALACVFTDGGKRNALDAAYRRALGTDPDYDAERAAAKREIITWNLEGELGLLADKADALARMLAAELSGRDGLHTALVTVMAAFPVYRTYVNATGVGAIDKALLDEVEAGIDQSAHIGKPLEQLNFIFRLLRLDVPETSRDAARAFVMRFQQTTGPVMAKAVEDTLFYRSNRLIALNEVGGDPRTEEVGPDAFHTAMTTRVRVEPHALSATATHDTKRGEDARARLYTLSEAPDAWGEAVERWRTMHAGLVKRLDDGPAPDPETEWMLYQALLGAWPMQKSDGNRLGPFRQRFLTFVKKAMREDKRRTRWTAIDEPYETAVRTYAERLVDPDNTAFLDSFEATAQPFAAAGIVNSLSQTLLKLTAPGIPDIYNGTENWDLSFVDPDNRRPVDFESLALSLKADVPWPGRMEDIANGNAKQHLIAAGLKARADHPELFADGAYEPIAVSGGKADRIVAFTRRHDAQAALVVVPRLVLDLLDGPGGIPPETWSDTRLELGNELRSAIFTDALTGETRRGTDIADVGVALAATPVGLFFAPQISENPDSSE